MAGIVATSVTTNNASDTAADKTVSGYLSGEEITLSADPSGSDYTWGLSVPVGSARTTLTSATSANPRFTPDVSGYYVVTVTVDSATVYVMRLQSVNVGSVSTVGAVRVLQLTDDQVSAPPTGAALYYSTTQASLAIKRPDDSVETISTTVV